MKTPAPNKPFGRGRWLHVLLRAAHLAAVVLLGAQWLDGAISGAEAAIWVALTGLLMFVLDIVRRPSHPRELAGFSVIVKLLLIVWMIVDADARLTLFWVILAGSVFFSHASAEIRHIPLFGRRPRQSPPD
ncbi:MAG: hypothetical protein LBE62_16225 [Azonexus sp.]|jgi:hypothetical protein|nr:hypothetical protein [Azonexus sp.]